MDNVNDIYKRLSLIGFRVTFKGDRNQDFVDIEKTIISSLYYIDKEGRLLGLIFSWLSIHGEHIIADKFFKEYDKAKEYLGDTPWFSGVCSFMYHNKDHRFKKGVQLLSIPHHFRNKDQGILIKIKGSVDFLEVVGILVASSSFRLRDQDIFSVDELINSNKQYKNRFLFGANWRAEIITAIQNGLENPNQIARRLGIQRSRVSIVFNEYMKVK